MSVYLSSWVIKAWIIQIFLSLQLEAFYDAVKFAQHSCILILASDCTGNSIFRYLCSLLFVHDPGIHYFSASSSLVALLPPLLCIGFFPFVPYYPDHSESRPSFTIGFLNVVHIMWLLVCQYLFFQCLYHPDPNFYIIIMKVSLFIMFTEPVLMNLDTEIVSTLEAV